VTPSGGRLAGTHGFGMLCVAATNPQGYDALAINWAVAQQFAAERGGTMDPGCLRLVGPMHLAETRKEAREQIRYGFEAWRGYFNRINRMGNADMEGEDPVDAMIERGAAVIGTPDDAIAQIERLEEKIPNFGTYLMLAHNWANWEDTKRSYALFARHVKPHFSNANHNRHASLDWADEHSGEFMGATMRAAAQMIERHQREEAEKARKKVG
jgi:limonene 1,2-monooxygenase